MRIILSGMGGHMGAEVLRLAKDGFRGAEVVCGVDPKGAPECGIPCVSSFDEVTAEADCIIDFSHHAGTAALTAFARAKHLPLVIATTGQTEEEKAMIREAGFSLGLQMMTGLFGQSAESALDTAEKLIALSPDTVRIYPAIVMPDTELAALYQRGEYVPQELDEAAEFRSSVLQMLRVPLEIT